jgi:hypothetical protein
MILKSPRYISESFFEGQVVWKNFAFTKALPPPWIPEEGFGSCLQIADSILGTLGY